MWWPKTERQTELLALAGRLADRFSQRAAQHDRDGTFPYENFRDLAECGYLALTNSAASEPETGSPSRGGRPATTAVAEADGSFTITGRKTFTTMAPALRFIMVSATIASINGTNAEAGQFLLESGMPGMRIEE